MDGGLLLGVGAYLVVLLFFAWTIHQDVQARVRTGGDGSLTGGEVAKLILLPPIGLGVVAIGAAIVIAVVGGFIVVGALFAALSSN
jgi:hypothetical protein